MNFIPRPPSEGGNFPKTYIREKIEELSYYGDSQHIDERQHLEMILKLLIMNAD